MKENNGFTPSNKLTPYNTGLPTGLSFDNSGYRDNLSGAYGDPDLHRAHQEGIRKGEQIINKAAYEQAKGRVCEIATGGLAKDACVTAVNEVEQHITGASHDTDGDGGCIIL